MVQAAGARGPELVDPRRRAEPRDADVLRFQRSALLHPRAADALILAASPIPGRRSDRRPTPRPGRLRAIARMLLG